MLEGNKYYQGVMSSMISSSLQMTSGISTTSEASRLLLFPELPPLSFLEHAPLLLAPGTLANVPHSGVHSGSSAQIIRRKYNVATSVEEPNLFNSDPDHNSSVITDPDLDPNWQVIADPYPDPSCQGVSDSDPIRIVFIILQDFCS